MKVTKGKYYKPRQTAFGILQPDREEIVKDLFVKNGKTVGYMTGYAVWNKMGLTSQISNLIEIGANKHLNRKRKGNYDIRFVLQAQSHYSHEHPAASDIGCSEGCKANS